MKKLQILALSMLLSTGFIAQASQGQAKQGGKDKQGQAKQGKQDLTQQITDATTAIGSPLSDALVATYANQLNPAISKLSTNSTNDEIKAINNIMKNIKVALLQLHPKAKPVLTEPVLTA